MPNGLATDRLIRQWNTRPARLLDVVFTTLQPNEKFRYGEISSAAFVLISRGKGELRLGNLTTSFDGGCALHVSGGSELRLTPERDTELYLFNYIFSVPSSGPASEAQDRSADCPFALSDLLETKRAFDALLEQWRRLGALDQLRLTSHLYELVHILLKQQHEATTEASPNTADPRIARALRYMEGHVSRTVTLADIAEAAGCGARRLSQLFHTRFERSPFQVLIGLRMERAKKHLRETSATLQQIAEQVGYANAYSFSRQFKHSCGCSPERYRKQDAQGYRELVSGPGVSPAQARLSDDLQAARNAEAYFASLAESDPPTANASPMPGAPAVVLSKPTRTVSTIIGRVEVPARPCRIVTDWSIGHLLALGEQPIGAPSTLLDNGGLLDAYWNLEPETVGTHNAISCERIAAMEPDLILTWNPQAYASYARIAPTLVFETDRCGGMEREMLLLGQWIGREKEASAWIRQARVRTHRLRARLNERFARPSTFTLADPYWCDTQVTLIGNAAHRGGKAVYDRLNLPAPPALRRMLLGSGEDSARISASELQAGLGEWVLVMNYDDFYGLNPAPDWDRDEIAKRHRIVDLPWNRYFLSDPLSSLLQAEELTQMLDRPFSPF
ncbi:helix-turn-helix domain-containing protein [Saccharibacillus sacchari]|uniref:Helix-turn-helix domain-containing protein n=1 Tax=Saccharibacillus sacchari TaxID=456493 RepID=A0ACC6PAL6_9BACL